MDTQSSSPQRSKNQTSPSNSFSSVPAEWFPKPFSRFCVAAYFELGPLKVRLRHRGIKVIPRSLRLLALAGPLLLRTHLCPNKTSGAGSLETPHSPYSNATKTRPISNVCYNRRRTHGEHPTKSGSFFISRSSERKFYLCFK